MAESMTPAGFAFTFAMWSVMMVAMMAPSALPIAIMYSKMRNGRRSGALFGAGHLSVWIVFSVFVTFAQLALDQARLLSAGMTITNPAFSGALLILVGLYQLTSEKSRCLTKCQRPVDFLMTNFREGPSGALQLGIHHGLYCLGCCWALMLVLFVVGVMNIAWVAALTALILLEKFGPAGLKVARVSGAAIILAGVLSFVR